MAEDAPGWKWIAGCAIAAMAFMAGLLVDSWTQDVRTAMYSGRQTDRQMASLQAEVTRLRVDMDRMVSLIVPLVQPPSRAYIPRTGVDDP